MALIGQDSIFENVKSNVEQNTADLITRIANTTVGEKTFSVLERAAAPYRDTVAPNLSAALMTANRNYQSQHKDKSLTELFDYAKKDAVASSQEYYDNDPSQAWRRKISPGRALVALIGDVKRGEQATDKINWADASSVESVFTSGSAQFFSGLGDIGFNALDPLFAVAKAGKVAKLEALNRPLTPGGVVKKKVNVGRMETLVDDINKAAADKPSPIKPLFDLIDTGDVLAVQSYGFVSRSTNPNKLAQALLDANKLGGRQLSAEVAKVAIGDTASFSALTRKYPQVTAQMNAITGRIDFVENQIKQIQSTIQPVPKQRGKITLEEIQNIEAFNKKAYTDIKELQKQKKAIEKKELKPVQEQEAFLGRVGAVPLTDEAAALAAREGGQQTVFQSATTSTWSRSELIESRRARAAALNARGFWNDFGEDTPAYASDMFKATKAEARFIRVVDWFSPSGKLHETPAGIAIIDGIPGHFSQQEVDSRIRQAVRYGDMTPTQARIESQRYSRLNYSSERFQYLDKLEEKSFVSILRKQFPQVSEKFSKEQNELLYQVVRSMLQTTRSKRRQDIGDIIDKNYTMVDTRTGKLVVSSHIKNLVEQGARRIAEKEGTTEITKTHIKLAEKALRENPSLTSQIPNTHFSTDLKEIASIVKENPFLFEDIMRRVADGDVEVLSQVRKHAEGALQETPAGGRDLAFDATMAVSKQGYDKVVNALDTFYTFVWKPTTLLSLKYTTRNVFEGYLRVAASMVDMNSAYGYGWSEMVRGFNEGKLTGAINAAENMYQRGAARRNTAKFNELNNELIIADAKIATSAGALTKDGKKIAKKAINDTYKGIDKSVFKANDGLSMTIAVVEGRFNSVRKIAEGNAPSPAAIEMNAIYNELRANVVTNKLGNDFLPILFDQDFRSATARLIQLDAEDGYKALDYLDEIIANAGSKIAKVNTSKSGPIMKTNKEELQFFLDRVKIHTAHLRTFLDERNAVEGRISQASAKLSPVIKRNFEKDVTLPGGAKIGGALAGRSGEAMRGSTSAHNSSVRLLDRDIRLTGAHILKSGNRSAPIDIDSPMWAAAHAEYVNNVLMNDIVARKAVELLNGGMDIKRVQAELQRFVRSNDKDALVWKKERKVDYDNRNERVPTSWDDEVDAILEGQVLLYLRPVDAFGDELITKAANGTLTAVDSAKIPKSLRERVQGDTAITALNAATMGKNIVRSIFHFIGTLPEDHLVRHPFYNMVYTSEANRLARMLDAQGKDPGKYVAQIRYNASSRAYKELMQRMYSVERYTDLATLMRFVAPFYMAHQNSSRFWLGTSIRNPEVAIGLAKAYNAPFRGGFVEDENGNSVSWSNPWTSTRNLAIVKIDSLPISKNLKNKIKDATGQDFIGLPPNQMDVITQGQMPIVQTLGGPVGQVGGTLFLGWLADKTYDPNTVLGKMGMNVDDFQKYMMPYYEKTYGGSITQQVTSAINPLTTNSWVLSALSAVSEGKIPFPEVEARFRTRKEAAYDALVIEKTLNGQSISHDELSKLADERARNSLYVEAAFSFGGPVVAGKLGNEEFRELNQEYTMLQKQYGDPDAASIAFTKIMEERYDNPRFVNALTRVITTRSASNKFGLWATPATSNALMKNKALVESIDASYPDNSIIGAMFNQGNTATDYSPIIDDNYFSTTINGKPIRQKLTNDVERRRTQEYSQAWETYMSAVDFIEADAKSRGIQKGTDVYNEYYGAWKKRAEDMVATQFPLWGDRNKGFTQNESDNNVKIIERFLADEKYMSTVGNDLGTAQALKKYVEGREVIIAELEAWRAATGTKSIDAKTNVWFADWRDRMVDEIIKQNPEFKPIYTRYLQDDTFNQLVDYSS
jgi:hypothetical protein